MRYDGGSKLSLACSRPRSVSYLGKPAYLPLASDIGQRVPLQRHSGGNVIQMIARLKPWHPRGAGSGATGQQNARWKWITRKQMMADAGFRSLVVPLHADHVESIRPILLLLQAGVFGLLLIGSVNILNLLLVRANARAKESAVRKALGASGAHILSEVMVETTLLTDAWRTARSRGRGSWNPPHGHLRCRPFTAGITNRIQWTPCLCCPGGSESAPVLAHQRPG